MALKRKHDENGTTDDLSIDEEIYQQNMLFKLNSCCIKKELKLTKKYKKQLVL